MFCQNCGAKIPDGSSTCPYCESKDAPQVEATPVNEKKEFKGLSKTSRGYAALFTALLVFPSSLSIAIDLSFHRYDFWFGYVVGALIVVWVCAVLPVLKITPPAATALICFTSIVGYTFFIMKKTGHLEWLFQRALPLFILFALFVALDVGLVSGKKIGALPMSALISFEIGIYFIAMEWTATKDLANLHWSPIIACGFVSVAAVFLAFSYIKTLKK